MHDPTKSGTLFYIDTAERTAGATVTVTVGAVPLAGGRGVTDTLKLEPSESSVTVRVLLDNVFAEAFWQGGRVAMTVQTPPTSEAAMAVTALSGSSMSAVVLERLSAWTVESIWVSKEEVFKTPRIDRTGAKSDDDAPEHVRYMSFVSAAAFVSCLLSSQRTGC